MSTDVQGAVEHAGEGRASDGVAIRPVAGAHEFFDCEELFRKAFDFSERDAVPAREIFNLSLNGGISLAAFAGSTVVGFSYSFAGFDGTRPYLYSNGLAVLPDFQGRKIGLRLKQEQRRLALERGYDLIRWSCRPLASRLLYLYLNALGARLVDYRPGLYEPFLPGTQSDEAIIDWRLKPSEGDRSVGACETPRASVVVLTRTHAEKSGARSFRGWDARRIRDARCLVEIPWDVEELRRRSPEQVPAWHLGVRDAIQALLDRGFSGARVTADRAAARSFVEFHHDRSAR